MATQLLIIEPDLALLECYCSYFEHVGLQTTAATSAVEAHQAFTGQLQDAIMLEPDLPDNRCNRLLKTIADTTDRRPLPVVAVSRQTRFNFDFPVHRYFVKPVAMKHLLTAIREISGADMNLHDRNLGQTQFGFDK